MRKAWRLHPYQPDRVAALESALRVPSVVAQLLLCRGLHDARLAQDFLDAKLTALRDPEELPGAAAAADRIHAAISAGRRIVVYGDYDVDGVAATAILWQCLKLLSADAHFYLPNRIDEGYGLHRDSLASLAEQGARMIVTVDCGISALDEARFARDLGLELVISDHHELASELPMANAIVHPRLPGTAYPFGGLSGSGVAFKLAWAVCQRASGAKKVSTAMREFLLRATALAALGTIADMVPLVDENRILARHGLNSLREQSSVGIESLLKVAQLDQRRRLDSEDVGFLLAPRLNAAGRMGQAQLAVELLTTTSPSRAAELAAYIDELNRSRQSLEWSIYLAANKQAQEQFDSENDPALVLAGRGWHPGVIGIVAGRLAEKYHRPVVLIALDEFGSKPGIGSARSVRGFPLHAALAACSEHLVSHGGHAAAAGLKIDAARVDQFRDEFCEIAGREIAPADRVAHLWIDAEVALSGLTLGAIEQLDRLAPFGHGNSRPLLCTTGVTLAEPPRRIGNGGRHLAVRVVQHGHAVRGVAFGRGETADELANVSGPLAIVFRPVINEYRGRRSVELQLADWRLAEQAVAAP